MVMGSTVTMKFTLYINNKRHHKHNILSLYTYKFTTLASPAQTQKRRIYKTFPVL